jgi:drug/metabolite transporter (DMT)-like permease
MGKILLKEFSAPQVAWWRYLFALLAALCFFPFFRRQERKFPLNALPYALAMGLFTFFGSAVLQYRGLSLSTASANALIVAIEPLSAVLLAWLLLRERLGWIQGAAIALALFGFFLLSNLEPGHLRASLALFNLGNLFLLAAMPMEAIYSIISRKLAGRVDAIQLFVVAIAFGFLLLTLYGIVSSSLPPKLPSNGLSWVALLWLGPLGTALTYIFWTFALEDASVAAVSITLFLQPILGALFGTVFLGEWLAGWQIVGALLILGALALQTSQAFRRPI